MAGNIYIEKIQAKNQCGHSLHCRALVSYFSFYLYFEINEEILGRHKLVLSKDI